VRTDAPHGARVGLDGLGPQALELQVLQMLAIKAGKGFWESAGLMPLGYWAMANLLKGEVRMPKESGHGA
jgi:hypothetical protein